MTGRCRSGRRIAVVVVLLWLSGAVSASVTVAAEDGPASAPYRSPVSVALAPDGNTLYVSDRTAGNVTVLDVASRSKRGEIPLRGQPAQLALSADGSVLYAAERTAGTVAVIGTQRGRVSARISVGRWPRALQLAESSGRLFVANQDSHDVSVVDLAPTAMREIARVPVLREPSDLAISPDERYLVVANQLPSGAGTDPDFGARVSVIDCESLRAIAHVSLPAGSTVVNGVCVDPTGTWAYVLHQIGRFQLPITQLERGWVTTSALSLLDLRDGTRRATLLLDDISQGAADPHSVVCSSDGRQLWVSHAGVHEVSNVDIGRVHQLLEGRVPEELAAIKDGARDNIWVRIQEDPARIGDLENDLTALFIAQAIRRFPSGGKVPQQLRLSPDERSVFVANGLSGSVAILNADTGRTEATISLGPAAEPDAVRRGELIFRDATHAFQRWHSCATCHPNGGRVDALRWDFLRDGIGNPKETISLILVRDTPPHNWRGTRTDVRMGAETSLVSGHLIVPTKQTIDDLTAYLSSLQPEPSPHRTPAGTLTEAARRGQKLFEGKAQCVRCHPAPLFTDLKLHNVGVLSPREPDGRYDTPTLVELWRTAPYLHDGRAATLEDVLTTHNPEDAHGSVSPLSEKEIADLIAYLKSL